MWAYEHSTETTASPETIWSLFSDVANWPQWNAGTEWAKIDGPFTLGAEITMKPPQQDAVNLRIVELQKNKLFIDEARFDDIVIRTKHQVEQTDTGHTRIIYRTEISGPGSEKVGPELGPEITADFPDVLASLVKLAEA